MPDPYKLPDQPPKSELTLSLVSLTLFAGCLGYFGWGLVDERHFVDESAYVAQSSYFDLYLTGQWNHPAWVDYAAYDLPPLPKYFIGAALWSGGYRRPDLSRSWSWYGTNRKDEFVGTPLLVAARWPAVVLGAVGCVAIFWLGSLLINIRAGWMASVLLAWNPLYRMHARRAMSDVPAETFLLLGLVLGLIVWRRVCGRRPMGQSWLLVVGAGGLVGLATLAKLNGVMGGLVLVTWLILGLMTPTVSARSRWFLVAAGPVAAIVAFGTFVAMNPYLTSRPARQISPERAAEAAKSFPERVRSVYDHRAAVSRLGMKSFPHNALPTLADRVMAVAVQGFGRFGPFGPRGWTDSTIRYDWGQDRGAIVWGPLVAFSLIVLTRRGWREFRGGHPPLTWLPVGYFGVVVGVVTLFIPLAWDRYFLSIQAPSILVVACMMGAWRTQWFPHGPTLGELHS